MKKLIRRYPWSRLKPDEGFFIPCLDTAYVREEGLKAAVRSRVLSASAQIGIFNGQFGVLFQRGKR